MEIRCGCGQICTSRAGLTLHQKKCEMRGSELVDRPEKPDCFHPLVQELASLFYQVVTDSNSAFKDLNKSACRRARLNLLDIKEKIKPLRRELLTVAKSKHPDPSNK